MIVASSSLVLQKEGAQREEEEEAGGRRKAGVKLTCLKSYKYSTDVSGYMKVRWQIFQSLYQNRQINYNINMNIHIISRVNLFFFPV